MAIDRDTEEGLLRLRAVVRDNPRSTAFVALAHALSDVGRNDEAEEVSLAGLAQHPHLVTGQVALGRALIGRGRLREAQERLVEAARANPDHGDAFRWLGELILKGGQAAKARTLLEHAEELLPSDWRVAELLTEAGGSPLVRPTRPPTDFENTKVGDVRKLAAAMDVDREPANLGNGTRAVREDSITSEFEPTKVKNGAAPHTGPGAPPPSLSERSALEVRRHNTLAHLSRLRALWVRGGKPAQAGGLALGVLLLVGLAWLLRPGSQGGKPSASEPAAPGKPLVAAVDMTAAIAAGSLDGLSAVRALGKRLLEMPGSDADQIAAAAFASALLACDYGVPGTADALELAAAAAKVQPTRASRTALVEGARALVAIAAGHLNEAHAAAGRALAAAPDSAEALLASGRVLLRQGKVAEARAALGKATSRVPVIAAAALDRAAAAIDAGDADTAATELGGLLARQNDLRALLLLAEAERLAGKPASAKGLKERCRDEGRDSAIVRTSCAAEAAAAARLAGDRAAAVRGARNATAGGGRNPRAMAQGALLLANLGEVDPAADALRKIRDDTGPGFVPRVFAQLAVALGRGEKIDDGAELPALSGPEARLLAARIAFSRGGAKALAEFLATLSPPLVAQDPELGAFAALASETPPPADRLKALEERADKAGGLASYVLGRFALAAGDGKTAAVRLQRAIQSSSEACEAARLLLTIDKKARPAALGNDAKIAGLLRAHDHSCAKAGKGAN